MDPAVRAALDRDQTIDIITTGRKTGQPRTVEIWYCRVDDRIIICGTPDTKGTDTGPRPRDWLANLKADPNFQFCLKESLQQRLPARARIVTDVAERRYVMSAPATAWYRERVQSVEDLVRWSPIIDVRFL